MDEKNLNEIEGKKVFVGEFDENEVNNHNDSEEVNIEDNIIDEIVKDPINKTKKKKKPMSKKTKIIIICSIILGVIILAIVLFFVLKPKKVTEIKEEKKIIDTGYDWSDKYAKYIEKNMINKYNEIEGAFIDFDGKDDPEMVINYEKLDNDYTVILYISDEEVVESDKYRDGDISILYSVETKEKDWYLEINNETTYIPIVQLINPEVKNIDIENSSISKDNYFKDSYIEADIDVEFYDIKKRSLEKNIKFIIKAMQENFVPDYEEQKILNIIKTKIEEEVKKQEEEENKKKQEEEASKKLTVNSHNLTYGKYAWYAKEDGLDSDYQNTIVIKKEGTCTYDLESVVGTCTYKIEEKDSKEMLCIYTDKEKTNCYSVEADNKITADTYTLTYRNN